MPNAVHGPHCPMFSTTRSQNADIHPYIHTTYVDGSSHPSESHQLLPAQKPAWRARHYCQNSCKTSLELNLCTKNQQCARCMVNPHASVQVGRVDRLWPGLLPSTTISVQQDSKSDSTGRQAGNLWPGQLPLTAISVQWNSKSEFAGGRQTNSDLGCCAQAPMFSVVASHVRVRIVIGQ